MLATQVPTPLAKWPWLPAKVGNVHPEWPPIGASSVAQLCPSSVKIAEYGVCDRVMSSPWAL